MLQYSQEDDTDLCLKRGVRFNADLYLAGTQTTTPDADDRRDANGCPELDTTPRQTCEERKADGCMASVYGRFASGGVLAGAELNSFELGPIAFEDSKFSLALTPSQQHLRLRGGAKIAKPGYEFASGRGDLNLGREGFSFKGNLALFNRTVQGYLEAEAAPDPASPKFEVEAWLGDDGRNQMRDAVRSKLDNVAPTMAAIGKVLAVVNGAGSAGDLDGLKGKLQSAGAPVGSEVDTMTSVLGEARKQLSANGGPQLTLDRLLKGFTIGIPGTPGEWSPWVCDGFYWFVDGKCYPIPGVRPGTWIPPQCLGEGVIDGVCYATKPHTIAVGGICAALNISSTSYYCTWAGLMARYVRPALRTALQNVTGAVVSDARLQSLVSQFAQGTSEILRVECAHLRASAGVLAQGNVSVDLAARLRFFGQQVKFGGMWNFNAGGSPEAVLKSLLESSSSSRECPPLPAGSEQAGGNADGFTLTASTTPGPTEGGEVTLQATFDQTAANYPAVTVGWGDGSEQVIAEGQLRTVAAKHRYVNEGSYPITLTVEDAGAYTRETVSVVQNAAPVVGSLGFERRWSFEGAEVTLHGSFEDPGAADKHTVRVSWGDDSPMETVPLETGKRTFALKHRYDDERMSYNVNVWVADGPGMGVNGTVWAEVQNAAPSEIMLTPLKVVTAAGAVDANGVVSEGDVTTYALEFSDPGKRDTHQALVEWGDGTAAETFDVPAGARRIEIPHRYADDGAYVAKVTVTDGDRGRGQRSVPLQVRNVAPVLSAQLQSASIAPGGRARIAGTIADPGPDRHTVTIDWGAGLTQTIAIEPGTRTFEADSQFATAGRFPIKVTVADDDHAEDSASLDLTVG
jgi:hypothetical protein